jgi:hypothetical protein
MRKKVLAILGVLLVAASTGQMETAAAARSVRKVARAHHPATQQLRNAFAFGSANWRSTAASDHSNHNERHGLSAPAAVGNKSCDRLWCYEN